MRRCAVRRAPLDHRPDRPPRSDTFVQPESGPDAGVAAALLAGPALARQAAAPAQTPATPARVVEDEDFEVDAVTVTASRQQPGSVIGDIPPRSSCRRATSAPMASRRSPS
ncbi:hypothetical protein [Caulobacter sp. B11]|uniref:hypothetical protein n=1 Tax=Caulobacter sp. B11 TaxID=2048899 RepID=UPI00117F7551|nr:hypothetical protein [Caulobacter sp. B11]